MPRAPWLRGGTGRSCLGLVAILGVCGSNRASRCLPWDAVGLPLCWLCGQGASLDRSDGPKGWSHICPSGPLGPKLSALECLEGMASGLYSELFTLLISLVNR